MIVVGFCHDCPFGNALPLSAILRVDAFGIFFQRRRSLSWIEAVNPVPLLGEVHRLPISQAPSPAGRMSQLLRFAQVCSLVLQLLGEKFLLRDIDRGAKEPFENFALNNGNSDASNVALPSVRANNSFCYIAARAFRIHCFYGVSHGVAVLWVNSG